ERVLLGTSGLLGANLLRGCSLDCHMTGFLLTRAVVVYQLDLCTPGNSPRWAVSRTRTRESPNFRRGPRGRPSAASRLRNRTGLTSRGSRCSADCAMARSASEVAG